MTRSEIIRNHYSEIADEMIEHYRTVLESEGHVQYNMYIWEDGTIYSLEQVQGDGTYLVPNDMETRQLYYIDTVAYPFFNPWDAAGESAPDDDAEREAQEAEIIDYLVDQYRNNIDDVMERIITDAECDEMFEEKRSN